MTNVTLGVGDAYALDSPDNTFDIVHAHQVLQHLADRAWWNQMWADRVTGSAPTEQAVSSSLATHHELNLIADAWRSALSGLMRLASVKAPRHGNVLPPLWVTE